MQKTNAALKGKLDSIRRVKTRTEMSMATFSVDEAACKAFGQAAEVLLGWAPGDIVELQGSYETRSQKFGREFVADHGQRLRKENTASAVFVPQEPRTIDDSETSKASAPSPSTPTEPIPAKEPIGFKTDLTAKETSNPLSYTPPA
jgi:hypothetical protein